MNTLNKFLAAVNKCKGTVWLETNQGDRYCLQSTFSQYLALGKLLEENSSQLTLVCQFYEDISYFREFKIRIETLAQKFKELS